MRQLENKIDLKAIEGSKPNLPIELKTIQTGNIALPKTWRIEQGKNNIITFNKKTLIQDDNKNIKILNSIPLIL